MGKNIISNTAEMNALLTWHYTYIITVVNSSTAVKSEYWRIKTIHICTHKSTNQLWILNSS